MKNTSTLVKSIQEIPRSGLSFFSHFPMNGEGMPRISRVVLFVGTRPEIIKMASVYHGFKSVAIKPLVIHSMQHEAAVKYLLYDLIKMYSAISLLIGRTESGLARLTEQLLSRVSVTLRVFSPDHVLIQSDTITVYVNALASSCLHLPVEHVEAGLRSGNNVELFRDKANRQLISLVSTWHFVPTSLYQCPRARSAMIIHDNQFGDSRAT